MRDATELEVNSINDYINRISVDTDVNFYNRRGERGMIIKLINLTIRTIRMLIAKWCMAYLEDYWNFIKK